MAFLIVSCIELI